MTENPVRHVRDRADLLSQLTAAGWDVETWDDARNAGVRVDLDFEAEYVGRSAILRLERLSDAGYLVVQLAEPDGELLLRLRLHPSGDLSPILHRIIAAQDSVDRTNHPALVKALVPLCRLVEIETEEGLFRLS